jgi:hypothetical protein
MLNIKFILMFPLAVLIILALQQLRHQLFCRLSVIIMSLTGLVFVAFPEITSALAHRVGVGRGADLIIYLYMILFFIVSVALYMKIKNLEAKQTAFIRKVAIQQVEKLN